MPTAAFPSRPRRRRPAYFLKKAAGIKSGSKEPSKVSAGRVTRAQLEEIANAKMKDLNATSLDGAVKIIEGSARAMGLQVVEAKDMAKLTKKQKALAAKIDTDRLYAVDEAIETLKANMSSKFDETIEVALNLGVDPRHADQMVAASCRCPRAPARTCASPSSPAPARPRKPLRRAPKWSGPRI
jgi:hypothetical protein